jgi:hypothetical protein
MKEDADNDRSEQRIADRERDEARDGKGDQIGGHRRHLLNKLKARQIALSRAIISGANPIPRNARDRSGCGDNCRATDRPVRADRPISIERATSGRDARVKGRTATRAIDAKTWMGVPLCGSPSDQEYLGK